MSVGNRPDRMRHVRRLRLFDVVPGRHRPKLARNGAIFVLLTAVFLYVIYTKPPLPFGSSGSKVTANFAYAADIVPGRTPVRVHGVDVGTVSGVSLLPGNRGVQVSMTLDRSEGSVRQDATAVLRWRTLLGLNYYVDLDPGSTSAPPLAGAAIPESHTSSQIELDQVLEPLSGPGRHGLRTMIDQSAVGLADPASVKQTIDASAPAMRNLAAGLPALRGTAPGVDLPNAVTQTDKWIGALARDETNVAGVITSGDSALAVTASRAADLGATLDTAPQALAQTQTTMARLRTTLDTLEPIARGLEPGATRLYRAAALARTAVALANPLLAELKPTLNAIRPSVVSLAATARAGVPAVKSLSRTLDRTQSSFIPFLNTVDSGTKLKNYEAIGPALASVSSVLGYGDSYGALAGFEAGVGENVIGGVSPCSTFVNNPDVTQQVDCAAITQLLEHIFAGRPVTQPLQGSPVAAGLVNKLLGVLGKR
jgi:virulence factor Mce-like protein